MPKTRISLLEEYIKESPGDPFLHYALALELRQTDPARTARLFTYLLAKHPDYLGTYYQAGIFYATHNQPDLAIQTIQKGMQLAQALGEWKTKNELAALLEELKDDQEE